ncbi:hypothetical protein V2I01_30235 [Micromonospora sp. BRA006-A]|nr:hypothetical protein [Micromonospora sp. BRA006-A]
MSEPAGTPVPGLAKLWTYDPVTAGRYRLLGRLGAGGQGVVYLGEDDAGDRVAVKMVNVDLTDARARSQFVKEIAAARRVARSAPRRCSSPRSTASVPTWSVSSSKARPCTGTSANTAR